ncbi:unnamed protein product [Nesidiocoris tenuis]|uniref:Uncharacterized protein n=1 Tax=Nesidiocoris tenuis TaxID=355587 RepID=A0A6H5GJF2_9HEMI|nr:unnamed protein product [Nesidiocoris tenuis]
MGQSGCHKQLWSCQWLAIPLTRAPPLESYVIFIWRITTAVRDDPRLRQAAPRAWTTGTTKSLFHGSWETTCLMSRRFLQSDSFSAHVKYSKYTNTFNKRCSR